MYSSLSSYLGGGLGAFMGILFVVLVIGLFLALIMLVSLWKIFTKAGQPGWAAIIPFYNKYILVKVARLPVYYFVALYLPFLLVVAKISVPYAISNAIGIAILCVYGFIMYNLCKQFSKGIVYTVGMTFLPFIFYPMLAFGDSVYQGEVVSLNEDTPSMPSQNSAPVENPVITVADQVLVPEHSRKLKN